MTSTSSVNNGSLEELQFSKEQVIPLGMFCFIMTFFGIFGNGTVIYSSLRYNAIKIDKISLILVQSLALADILYSFCVILPQFITYAAGRWVLGHVYCIVMAQIGIIPVSANTLTVLAITSYRLRVILSPFSTIQTKTIKKIIAGIWGIALVPTTVFISYRSKSTFHVENGRCLSDIYDNDAARIPVMTLVGLIVILPLFAISIFNSILTVIAVRHSAGRNNDRKSYRALVMVCALSGLFIVSWTPYIVFTFMKMRTTKLSPVLDLLSFHCIFINSFGNPILYSLTNRRFGKYVRGLLTSFFCGLWKVEQRPVDGAGDSRGVKMVPTSSSSKNNNKQ